MMQTEFKYSFDDFIKNPEKYSSGEFIQDNENIISELGKIKLSACQCNKEAVMFDDPRLQTLYDSSPGFPTVQCILDNPDNIYIIAGGMRMVGARYPDYIITAKDILYLKKVMDHYGIMKIPMRTLNDCIEKCIVLVQIKLKTNLFHNAKTPNVFSMVTDSFRNLCMGIRKYDEYKGKFLPTNISMLMFYTGDCREHCLLLLYVMRIYLHYNDTENTHRVVPVYTAIGCKEQGRFIKIVDHTFPIMVNKRTHSMIVLDAWAHKTPVHQNPIADVVTYKNISVHKIDGGIYYSTPGAYVNKRGKAFFVPVKWFKTIKCEYANDNYLKNKVFLYGIPFEFPSIKWVFDTNFNNLIVTNLYNANLCKPKMTMKTKIPKSKKNKTKRH
jgi:hypothetical protein